jgi:hypothetical protein
MEAADGNKELARPGGTRRESCHRWYGAAEAAGPAAGGAAAARQFRKGLVLSFESEDLVLDPEFLALEVADRVVIRKRSIVLLEDGLLQAGVTGPERLQTILQRHLNAS